MVTQLLETAAEPSTEEEAPAPAEAEETPELDLGESPAEEAAEPEEAVPETPDLAGELKALREELAELKAQRTQTPQRSEADIRAEIAENLRVQTQADEEQRQQEQTWRDELDESLHAVLVTNGYTEVPAEHVRAVGERFINKRYDQITARTVGDVRDALIAIKDVAQGKAPTVRLNTKSQKYANELRDSFNVIYQTLQAEARKGYVAEADLDKVWADRQAKENAAKRKDEQELVRVKGTPVVGNIESIEYWDTRVAHEGEDGYPVLTNADWAKYHAVRRANGIN